MIYPGTLIMRMNAPHLISRKTVPLFSKVQGTYIIYDDTTNSVSKTDDVVWYVDDESDLMTFLEHENPAIVIASLPSRTRRYIGTSRAHYVMTPYAVGWYEHHADHKDNLGEWKVLEEANEEVA